MYQNRELDGCSIFGKSPVESAKNSTRKGQESKDIRFSNPRRVNAPLGKIVPEQTPGLFIGPMCAISVTMRKYVYGGFGKTAPPVISSEDLHTRRQGWSRVSTTTMN